MAKINDEGKIVLVNKGPSQLTINFMGAFLQNKMAPKNGKFYLTEKEYEWLELNFPHLLEGEEKRLYAEGEEQNETTGDLDDEAFFKQHHTKIKKAISEMTEAEAEQKLEYANLNEVSESTIKALEDRILELDKTNE